MPQVSKDDTQFSTLRASGSTPIGMNGLPISHHWERCWGHTDCRCWLLPTMGWNRVTPRSYTSQFAGGSLRSPQFQNDGTNMRTTAAFTRCTNLQTAQWGY